jgi:hypothetical protein
LLALADDLAPPSTCNQSDRPGLRNAAAEICRRERLATADAIVYATSRQFAADFLTCDAHLEGLPGVLFIPKIDTKM